MVRLDTYEWSFVYVEDKIVAIMITTPYDIDIADIVTEATAYNNKAYCDGRYFWMDNFEVRKDHKKGISKLIIDVEETERGFKNDRVQ